MARAGVYVLRLRGGRYYVGSSADIDARVAAHRAGRGAAFTKAYPVEEEIGPATFIADTESWERAETLYRMRAHGIGAVRGWMWTTVRLSPAQRRAARDQIRERYAACRRCGRAGHFVAECREPREGPAEDTEGPEGPDNAALPGPRGPWSPPGPWSPWGLPGPRGTASSRDPARSRGPPSPPRSAFSDLE